MLAHVASVEGGCVVPWLHQAQTLSEISVDSVSNEVETSLIGSTDLGQNVDKPYVVLQRHHLLRKNWRSRGHKARCLQQSGGGGAE